MPVPERVYVVPGDGHIRKQHVNVFSLVAGGSRAGVAGLDALYTKLLVGAKSHKSKIFNATVTKPRFVAVDSAL